jgi:hypothetical protein
MNSKVSRERERERESVCVCGCGWLLACLLGFSVLLFF